VKLKVLFHWRRRRQGASTKKFFPQLIFSIHTAERKAREKGKKVSTLKMDYPNEKGKLSIIVPAQKRKMLHDGFDVCLRCDEVSGTIQR
jgi:hypothetical protein